jgi:hypothetical protein
MIEAIKPLLNMGWVMGLEPMTSGITIQYSTSPALFLNNLQATETANKERRTLPDGDKKGDSHTIPCSGCTNSVGWFFVAAYDRQFFTIPCCMDWARRLTEAGL